MNPNNNDARMCFCSKCSREASGFCYVSRWTRTRHEKEDAKLAKGNIFFILSYSSFSNIYIVLASTVILDTESNDEVNESSAAIPEINANNEVIKLTESDLNVTPTEFAEWEELMGEEFDVDARMNEVEYELPQCKAFYKNVI